MEDFSDHIGIRLKRAREAAGLSVDDVTFRTRIPRSVVNALEAGDFTVFSSPLYARSFLSQYSRLLNVNASRWLDALEPAEFVADEVVAPIWESAMRKKEPPPQRKPTGGWLPAVVLVAFSLALLYVGVKSYFYLDRRFSDPPAASMGRPASDSGHEVPLTGENPPEVIPSQATGNPEPANPPPRAIIVR